MIVLSGADLVLPDKLLGGATLVLEGDRISQVLPHGEPAGAQAVRFSFPNHYIVPGFIDVHVHGVGGQDTLDGRGAIQAIAERLPAFGVTAFCPTSMACSPLVLARMLEDVRAARTVRPPGGARVLPAHLESNFINPDFNGAQPLACLRQPPATAGLLQSSAMPPARRARINAADEWSGEDIVAEIAQARPDVGIVTLAPELPGALALIEELAGHGHHVSLGHSGASYQQAVEGIRAGARQATHLFNRMPALSHRAPGLAGAVLESDEVVAELICDGVHVHPAVLRTAIAAKRPERIMAITDGTAGSGLPFGATASLGGRPITVRDAAYLADGTIAGSVSTMDRTFARLASVVGLSLSDAAILCSTTPARALGLRGFGVISPGATADFVVLDRDFQVVQTWIAGTLAYGGPSKVTV